MSEELKTYTNEFDDWDNDKTPYGELYDVATKLKLENDALRKQLEVLTQKVIHCNKAHDKTIRKLNVAMVALKDISNWYEGHNDIIARDALAEIERIQKSENK